MAVLGKNRCDSLIPCHNDETEIQLAILLCLLSFLTVLDIPAAVTLMFETEFSDQGPGSPIFAQILLLFSFSLISILIARHSTRTVKHIAGLGIQLVHNELWLLIFCTTMVKQVELLKIAMCFPTKSFMGPL